MRKLFRIILKRLASLFRSELENQSLSDSLPCSTFTFQMNTMRSLFFLFSVLNISAGLAQTPFDTTAGRYRFPLFDSVQVISDVLYAQGINISGQSQALRMDVYQPYQDAAPERPVLLMVHGGSFLQGNKLDLAETCRYFARLGYVTASIQYRLGYSSFTPQAAVATVIRATQDLKNAIRFLKKQSALYRIHPEFVFAGGVSAGAITALHAAYMDQLSEIPQGQSITSLDSLHNQGQIPGYDWRFKGVINIAGGIGDTSWILAGDLPVTSFHGTADATVPYESGSFGLGFNLFGSYSIHLRAAHVGISSFLRPFPGAGHDYTVDNPWAADTTLASITRFLFPLLTASPTGISLENDMVFPLRLSASGWEVVASPEEVISVYDISGRLDKKYEHPQGPILLPFSSGLRVLYFENRRSRYLLPPIVN